MAVPVLLRRLHYTRGAGAASWQMRSCFHCMLWGRARLLVPLQLVEDEIYDTGHDTWTFHSNDSCVVGDIGDVVPRLQHDHT